MVHYLIGIDNMGKDYGGNVACFNGDAWAIYTRSYDEVTCPDCITALRTDRRFANTETRLFWRFALEDRVTKGDKEGVVKELYSTDDVGVLWDGEYRIERLKTGLLTYTKKFVIKKFINSLA